MGNHRRDITAGYRGLAKAFCEPATRLPDYRVLFYQPEGELRLRR